MRLLILGGGISDPWNGLTIDSKQYVQLAETMLDTGRYQDLTGEDLDLFRSPGYPVFLAVILSITRGSLAAVIVVQVILNLLCAVFLYLIGKSIGSERVGLVASVVFLLSPNALFWSASILTETVFAFGLILAFLWMIKATDGEFPLWVVGILMGALTLIRPIGLYLFILWALWLLFVKSKRIDFRNRMKSTVIFLLGALLVVVPWFIRNTVQHDQFTLSSVSDVTIGSYHLALTLVEAEGLQWDEAKVQVARMGGGLGAAAEVIRSHPVPFMKVQVNGLARTMLGTEAETWLFLISIGGYPDLSMIVGSLLRGELGLNEALELLSSREAQVSVLLVAWGFVYSLALFGMVIVGFIRGIRKSDPKIRAVLVLALITVLYLLIIPGAAGQARFRVPIEPFLALFAGMAFF
ncbi:MAG: hypothetical protein GTO18_14060 [Anaerolineales bacterium]|nr:hypothetical protein [Anaerolineales bacterium]